MTIINGRGQEYEYKSQGGSNECVHKTQWSMLVYIHICGDQVETTAVCAV